MVNDLLELNDTALKLDKEWILDDKDNFWLENKYWHWKDVLGRFQKYTPTFAELDFWFDLRARPSTSSEEFLKPCQANYASKKKNFEATKKRKKEERDADGKLDPEELAQMLNDLPQEQERIQSTRSYAKYTALTQSIWSKGAPRMWTVVQLFTRLSEGLIIFPHDL